MTNPHDAFKALASISWDAINHDDLRSFLADTFVDAQCLIDSIPIPASLVNVAGSSSGGGAKSGRPRSATDPSGGGKGAKQQQPPPSRADKLRGEWKEVQVNPRDNPLGVTVYRMGSKDRKGAWFARRSVHAGVSFDRWRRGMEAEFAESLKVQGGPGEGRIRGIGADKRVANTVVDGCGRVEVYQLSAQFPGPTTPRDFVTLLLSSDSALDLRSQQKSSTRTRHYMLVSRPCIHPECPQRSGYIRGQYESVEFIREIRIEKPLRRTRSSIDFGNEEAVAAARRKSPEELNKEALVRSARSAAMSSSVSDEGDGEGRKRGKTIRFAGEQESEDDEDDDYEVMVEWLMVTRSDPGGSVPRFMVEKGTPAGIASDAEKFLKWVSSRKMEDFPKADQVVSEPQIHDPAAEMDTNHPVNDASPIVKPTPNVLNKEALGSGSPGKQPWEQEEEQPWPGGFYGMIAGALGAVASRLPNPLPLGSSRGDYDTDLDLSPPDSTNDNDDYDDDSSSIHSFHSLSSDYEAANSRLTTTESNEPITPSISAEKDGSGNAPSLKSAAGSDAAKVEMTADGKSRVLVQHEKELRKLEERYRKQVEKAERDYEKANSKRERERQKAKSKANKNKKSNNNSSEEVDRGEVAAATADNDEQAQQQEADSDSNKNDNDSSHTASHEATLAKIRERHARDVARQEEKYQRELRRAETRREAEQRKADERRRKEERGDLARELKRVRAERDAARRLADGLRDQVGELQAQNTLLVTKLGKLQGAAGGEAGSFIREMKRTESFRGSLGGASGSGSVSGSSGRDAQSRQASGSSASLEA